MKKTPSLIFDFQRSEEDSNLEELYAYENPLLLQHWAPKKEACVLCLVCDSESAACETWQKLN